MLKLDSSKTQNTFNWQPALNLDKTMSLKNY